MKRSLFLLALLLQPPAAHANAKFDLAPVLEVLRAGRDGDALYYLNRAIASRALEKGDLADALEWRAFLLARLGGAANVAAVLARSCSDPENYADLCEVLFRLGRRAEAADACERATRLDPEHPRPPRLMRLLGR